MTIDELLKKYNEYSGEDCELIRRAYEYARELHSGQYRASGEEYIIHPLSVALILADMHADKETLCAALLHDTIEDTNIKKEDISHDFGPVIAELVDGVTKLTDMYYLPEDAVKLANSRKIITSIEHDARIILIKLADRLHNMRTLEYKKPDSQQRKAKETMDLFIPLAYYIGAHDIEVELANLSLKYAHPDEYKMIEEQRYNFEQEYQEQLAEMQYKLTRLLNDREIPNEIKTRIKSVYGIYRKMSLGKQIHELKDIYVLKILVNEINNCYITLDLLHKTYPQSAGMHTRDYIRKPKTNLYQGLHTIVTGPEDRNVHAQVRTFDMDRVAHVGLSYCFDNHSGDVKEEMQDKLSECQFYSSLKEIDSTFEDDSQFMSHVESEVLRKNIHAYTANGDEVNLPVGSTVIDFAYYLSPDIGNILTSAVINGHSMPLYTRVNNKDTVEFVTDEANGRPNITWLYHAHTTKATNEIKRTLKLQ